MANNSKSVQIGARFERETHDALVKLAQKSERTVTWWVKKFVEQGLEREAKRKPARL